MSLENQSQQQIRPKVTGPDRSRIDGALDLAVKRSDESDETAARSVSKPTLPGPPGAEWADSDGSAQPQCSRWARPLDHLNAQWERSFRTVCEDISINVEPWRYLGAASADVLAALANLGVQSHEVWDWIHAVGNGYGAHGRTQGSRILQRITKWIAADFNAQEALAFSRAGIRLNEATRIAVRDETGRVAHDTVAGLELLAAFKDPRSTRQGSDLQTRRGVLPATSIQGAT